MSPTSRSCSEWNTWWMAVSAMFSLHATVTARRSARRASRRRRCPAGWCAKSADGVVSASGVGRDRRRRRVVVGVLRRRVRVVRDVGQERRVEVQHVGRHRHRGRQVALDQPGRRSRTAAGRGRAGDELAVRVGGDHRDVRSRPRSVEPEAEHRRGLRLDRRPGASQCPSGEPRVGRQRAAEQLAGGDRRAGGVDRRTRAGTPGARRARCRSGSGPPTASRCCWRPGRRRVGAERRPSGPGWFWARVSTMNRLARAGPRRRVPDLPSGPA